MRFQRNIFRRGGAGYEHRRRATTWCERVPDRYPEVIVSVRDEGDVVAAVTLAREEGRQISVCSGGHSWNTNHLRDGTVLINCNGLSDYAVDASAKTGWAQPGLRGSDLNLALQELGLYFPVGHCTDVSIGGFLLQGGIGWNNRTYGPACGHVTAIDAVLASGQAVHATDDNEYADLLWAARGAGPGFFAVVTKYHIQLYDRPRVSMNSQYVFPSRCLEDVLDHVHQFSPTTPTEINMMFGWEEHVDTTAPVINLNAMAWGGSEDEARDLLAAYERSPIRGKAIQTQLNHPIELVQMSALGADTHYLETKRYCGDASWINATGADMAPLIRPIVESLTGMDHILYTNFGTNDRLKRRPMCFSGDAPHYYGVYAVWDQPGEEAAKKRWLVGHTRALERYSTAMALADENTENRPFRFMTDANLRRLDQLRDKYDPDGRFVQWMGRPWPKSS